MAEWSRKAIPMGECGGLAPKGSLREKPLRLLSQNERSIMYTVYVLRSVKTGRNYYGHTGDLPKRFKDHNSGKVRSTKAYMPWKIIYTEDYNTKSEAYQRELFLKSIDGYKFLKKEGLV